jgi:hypothetical protein
MWREDEPEDADLSTWKFTTTDLADLLDRLD